MENPINHRDLESIVVDLVDSSAVAQAKPSRSSLIHLRDGFSVPSWYSKTVYSLSLIVNELKFVYLARSSAFHSPSQVGIL